VHRAIGTHEGETVWQGEDEWDEGVGVKEGQACAYRAGQSSPVNRWGSWCGERGHAPRLPAPKQHHQHARTHARAAAAAVIVVRGRGSRSWGGRRIVEQRVKSHANSMLAFLCPFIVISFPTGTPPFSRGQCRTNRPSTGGN